MKVNSLQRGPNRAGPEAELRSPNPGTDTKSDRRVYRIIPLLRGATLP
jgi:hypothetical protein